MEKQQAEKAKKPPLLRVTTRKRRMERRGRVS